MQYFLVKTESDEFSIDDLKQKNIARWDGVRNFQARNFMQQMQLKDLVLIYHTGDEKRVVGLAEVVKTSYPDPSDETEKFVCVDVKFKEKFPRNYSLAEMKQNSKLQKLMLIKQSRLSVMPMSQGEFQEILAQCHQQAK